MMLPMVAAIGAALMLGQAPDAPKSKAAPKSKTAPRTKDAPKSKDAPKTKDATKAAGDSDQQSSTKAAYAFGLNLGRSFKKQAVDLDPDSLIQGLRDGLAGRGEMTDQQIQETLVAYQQGLQARKVRADAAALEGNKTQEGVKVLPGGVQYKVLKQGNGPSPKPTDTVKVHYKGTLLDGTVFDSSYARNEPTTFQVGEVIEGWTEALQKMKVGDKWQIWVPADKAYGDTPPGPPIYPGAPLMFEVELLGIEQP